MTRSSLNQRLRIVYLMCALILVLALFTRFADVIPGLEPDFAASIAPKIYAFLRDMALVFVTIFAAYLANVFQQRAKFLSALEAEWRSMVATKTALLSFCQKPRATLAEYLDAYGKISATIDNMRIVYRNVGETNRYIGLYPYEPLHDMRRALESLDPRKDEQITDKQQKFVHGEIEQAFLALREVFLEEIDLEEPYRPITTVRARRDKVSGAHWRARWRHARQQEQAGQKGGGG